MTSGVFAAVLLGALLHAGWNALIKAGQDKALDTALMHVMGIALAAPIVAVAGLPAAASWPWLAASVGVHLFYYITLAGAYRHGELGLTYPIMRGSAPLLVALASGPLVGESLSPLAWWSVLAVCLGVVAVGLSPRAASGHPGKALRFALANAAVIAVYTVVDGIGVRLSGNAASYVATLFLFNGVPFFMLVMWQRRASRAEALGYMARRWPLALCGAAASLGSYGIALWAMTRAPVAAVAALRETSVLFAAVIGVVWLKESVGGMRAGGTVLILLGVIGIRGWSL